MAKPAANATAQANSLNRPRPVRVEPDGRGRPGVVQLSGRALAVESVLDEWRVEDEWWREEPVSRWYYAVLLEDGRSLTVFHDLVRDRWYEQRYG